MATIFLGEEFVARMRSEFKSDSIPEMVIASVDYDFPGLMQIVRGQRSLHWVLDFVFASLRHQEFVVVVPPCQTRYSIAAGVVEEAFGVTLIRRREIPMHVRRKMFRMLSTKDLLPRSPETFVQMPTRPVIEYGAAQHRENDYFCRDDLDVGKCSVCGDLCWDECHALEWQAVRDQFYGLPAYNAAYWSEVQQVISELRACSTQCLSLLAQHASIKDLVSWLRRCQRETRRVNRERRKNKEEMERVKKVSRAMSKARTAIRRNNLDALKSLQEEFAQVANLRK